MEAQHSPRPWLASDEDVDCRVDVFTGPEQPPHLIAQVVVQGARDKVGAANKSLIITAPELLDAAQYLVDALGVGRPNDGVAEGLARLQAVIAKAKGETSAH